MASAGLDAVVVGGSTGPLETSVQYFTNWPPQVPSYLVVTPGEAPVLFVRLWNHLPDAQRIAVTEDVRYGGDTPASQAQAVADLLGGQIRHEYRPHRLDTTWRPARSPRRPGGRLVHRSDARLPGLSTGEVRYGDVIHPHRLPNERRRGGRARIRTSTRHVRVRSGSAHRRRVPKSSRGEPHPLQLVHSDGRSAAVRPPPVPPEPSPRSWACVRDRDQHDLLGLCRPDPPDVHHCRAADTTLRPAPRRGTRGIPRHRRGARTRGPQSAPYSTPPRGSPPRGSTSGTISFTDSAVPICLPSSAPGPRAAPPTPTNSSTRRGPCWWCSPT